MVDITVLILTFNESANIRRVIERLTWAKEIVVIDSFSTDSTLDILKTYPTVRIIQRSFDSFAKQCNFGLTQIHSQWVLSLDADYVLSSRLCTTLLKLQPDPSVAGFRVPFSYCVAGKALRASLYPPRTVLYKKACAKYEDVGHGHKVIVAGLIEDLEDPIFHDDRKPLDRWFKAQMNYAAKEAVYLSSRSFNQLNFPDRIRKLIIFAPLFVFCYTFLGKGLILNGWSGFFYAMQRTLSEMLLSLALLEAKLNDVVTAEPN